MPSLFLGWIMRFFIRMLLVLLVIGAGLWGANFYRSEAPSAKSDKSEQIITLLGEQTDTSLKASLLQSEYDVSFMHVNDPSAIKVLRDVEKGSILHHMNAQGLPVEYTVKDVIVSTVDELDLGPWGYKEKSLLLINSSLPLVNNLADAQEGQHLYISVIAEKAAVPLLAENVENVSAGTQKRFIWDVFL